MANGNEWLGKLLLYGALGAGAIVGLYYGVKTLLLGGGQAFLNEYNKSLAAYVNKMNGFASKNNGVLNEAQKASKDFEEKQLNGLAANAASSFNNVWGWLLNFIIVGAIAALAFGVFKNPDVIAKWKGIITGNPPRSPKAQCIMLDLALVDQLAVAGYSVEASNFLLSLQETWQTIDAPYMQQQITVLQQQIDAGILVGVELELAHYFVQAYTYELSMIPTVLTLPLVPLV